MIDYKEVQYIYWWFWLLDPLLKSPAGSLLDDFILEPWQVLLTAHFFNF